MLRLNIDKFNKLINIDNQFRIINIHNQFLTQKMLQTNSDLKSFIKRLTTKYNIKIIKNKKNLTWFKIIDLDIGFYVNKINSCWLIMMHAGFYGVGTSAHYQLKEIDKLAILIEKLMKDRITGNYVAYFTTRYYIENVIKKKDLNSSFLING